MKTHSSFRPLTLAGAFEQFLEVSSFARRTRESYAEDLVPLLAEVGQQPVTALTADMLQPFFARVDPPYITEHTIRFGLYQVDRNRQPKPLMYEVSLPDPEDAL